MRAGDEDYKLYDEKGLYLLVAKAGSKRWYMKYRHLGPERKLSFGAYGGVMTAHGFRSTASTLLNESKRWSPDAIERALAHETRTPSGRLTTAPIIGTSASR